MSNSAHPDEIMSRLIWLYTVCKSLLLSLVAVKDLMLVEYKVPFVSYLTLKALSRCVADDFLKLILLFFYENQTGNLFESSARFT